VSQNQPTPASDDPRHQFHKIGVYDVVRETRDASSFIFEIPAELEQLFQYHPGQFLTFEIPWQDFRVRRCYSLASTPSWGERPKVTVKRVDEGRVSNWMNDNLEAGARILAMPPTGPFVLHEDRTRKHPMMFFGGGSGVTPVISLIKQALRETSRRVKLVYANRDPDSIIFRAELEAIAAQFADRFELVHHLDTTNGFLAEADIVRHIEGRLDSDFYICGPTPFMDTIENVLAESALEGGAVHIERFVSALDPDRQRETDPEPATQGEPGTIRIKLDGAAHEIEYRAGEPILAAAIRAGLDVPYSCQDGYCGCCMAKLRAGEVQMATHEALTKRELADGWVLTCQAKPITGVCEVEFED